MEERIKLRKESKQLHKYVESMLKSSESICRQKLKRWALVSVIVNPGFLCKFCDYISSLIMDPKEYNMETLLRVKSESYMILKKNGMICHGMKKVKRIEVNDRLLKRSIDRVNTDLDKEMIVHLEYYIWALLYGNNCKHMHENIYNVNECIIALTKSMIYVGMYNKKFQIVFTNYDTIFFCEEFITRFPYSFFKFHFRRDVPYYKDFNKHRGNIKYTPMTERLFLVNPVLGNEMK
jgi:hypothetical protein